uniref:Cytochrome b n=1 Tax=Echinostoma hortense TaxID=48216 RepID=A0A0M4JC53_9TREM|nr:cytochrome b [Echinostoma hortense]
MIFLIRSNVVNLPTNVSLNYLWCGGFMISFFLILQVVSGVILSLLYVADSCLSFGCVLSFTSEGLFLWLFRYSHIWGVTFIFILFFVLMGRALYYSSYSMFGVWNVGFVLYLLMMIEAFLSYILPWHQMSYWAATVLTSVLNSIPIVGSVLYKFVVGGFSVTNVTLVRVFSAHVCLAFVILGFSVIHLFYLHKGGSNNPLFVFGGYGDVILFHSYYTTKDGFVLMCWGALLLVCPDLVLDVESYIEADPLVSPVSIKSEWYFFSLLCYASFYSVNGWSVNSGFSFFICFMVAHLNSILRLWFSSSVCFLMKGFNFWFIEVLGGLSSSVPLCNDKNDRKSFGNCTIVYVKGIMGNSLF